MRKGWEEDLWDIWCGGNLERGKPLKCKQRIQKNNNKKRKREKNIPFTCGRMAKINNTSNSSCC